MWIRSSAISRWQRRNQPQETGNAKRIHTAGRACGIAALKDGFTDIKILSDSQTAVGILTLNWKSSNYIDTISDIKENLGTLMRYGMRTTLSWIPGHANIAGNEIADQLAKEAAKSQGLINPLARHPGLVISTFGLAEIISCMPDGLVVNIRVSTYIHICYMLFNQQQCFIYSTASFLSKLRAKKVEKLCILVIKQLQQMTAYRKFRKWNTGTGNDYFRLCR
jgi:ribonuclease HI